MKKAQKVLGSPRKLAALLLVVTDIGPDLIIPTTLLEGDGFLMPFVKHEVSKLLARLDQIVATPQALQNTLYVAQKLVEHADGIAASSADFVQRTNAKLDEAIACIQPGIDYANKMYGDNGKLKRTIQVYEACELWNPGYISASTSLDSLVHLKFLDINVRSQLVREFPAYVAVAKTLSVPLTPKTLLDFFCKNQKSFSTWSKTSKDICSLAPSEAAAERVFGLADAMFSDQQRHSLQDTMEASVMLRYNDRVGSADPIKKKYKLGIVDDGKVTMFANAIDFPKLFPRAPVASHASARPMPAHPIPPHPRALAPGAHPHPPPPPKHPQNLKAKSERSLDFSTFRLWSPWSLWKQSCRVRLSEKNVPRTSRANLTAMKLTDNASSSPSSSSPERVVTRSEFDAVSIKVESPSTAKGTSRFSPLLAVAIRRIGVLIYFVH